MSGRTGQREGGAAATPAGLTHGAEASRVQSGAGPRWEGVPAGVLGLQRLAGNRAVAALLGRRDDGVLRRCCSSGGGGRSARVGAGGGKAKCARCQAEAEEEEFLRRTPEGHEGVERLAHGGVQSGGVAPDLTRYLRDSLGRGRPLDGGVRSGLESSFGRRLGDVRVHTGPMAAWAAQSVRARAFAFGRNIWFGAGEYRPELPEGRHLLAHEVAHTLEQRRPRSMDGLKVGSPSDPAEARAERAAELAVRRAPAAPLAAPRSEPWIRRYGIERVRRVDGDGDPTAEVELDNGIRYTVRKECRIIADEGSRARGFRPPRLSADADRQNVWVQVSWCEGTRGRVRAGADAPAQLGAAVRRLVEAALSGRSPDDVLSDATLTPFVDFAIAESGGIAVEGRVGITVGGEGVQSGKASLTLRRGPVDLGATGEAGGDRGFSVGLTLTFTPGRSSESEACPRSRRRTERLRQHCTFVCTHEPIEPRPPPVREPSTRREEARASLYFQHASTVVNEALSGPELTSLRSLLAQGYRVVAIEGFASPEGPVGPHPRGRFQGNQTLSTQRAERAAVEAAALCSTGGTEGAGCMVGDAAPVVGRGERFGATADEGQPRTELEGRALATSAVRDFMADPTEMARLRPEDREALGRARTPEARAAVIYPYLRRASFTLVRVVELPPPPVDLSIPRLPRDYFDCPADVLEAAQRELDRTPQPGPRR